jgi:hypothetical protein
MPVAPAGTAALSATTAQRPDEGICPRPEFIPGAPGKEAAGMKVFQGKLYVAGGFSGRKLTPRAVPANHSRPVHSKITFHKRTNRNLARTFVCGKFNIPVCRRPGHYGIGSRNTASGNACRRFGVESCEVATYGTESANGTVICWETPPSAVTETVPR